MSLGHIILIPSQPVAALTPSKCLLRGEAVNTILLLRGFDLTVGIEPTISCTRFEYAYHYTLDTVRSILKIIKNANVGKMT
jgi:hypothetical protein